MWNDPRHVVIAVICAFKTIRHECEKDASELFYFPHLDYAPAKIATYLLVKRTGLSFRKIGKIFKCSDKSAKKLYSQAEKLIEEDPAFREKIEHCVGLFDNPILHGSPLRILGQL